MRVEGLSHNLFSVLLLTGLPISLVGLIGLPWAVRGAAIRPVVIVSFGDLPRDQPGLPGRHDVGHVPPRGRPVPGAARRLGAPRPRCARSPGSGVRLGWTRPVAWLGPLLGIFGSLLFSVALLPTFGAGSRGTAERYDALAAGWPRSATRSTRAPARSSPTSRSGWPRRSGSPSLALPDEPPRDVLDLATDPRFNAKLVVLLDADSTHWPHDIDAGVDGAACFRELDLGADTSPDSDDPLADVRAFEVVCP